MTDNALKCLLSLVLTVDILYPSELRLHQHWLIGVHLQKHMHTHKQAQMSTYVRVMSGVRGTQQLCVPA